MDTTFDITKVLADIQSAFQSTYASKWPQVKETAADYLADAKIRLNELATNRLAGQYSDAYVIEMLAYEKTIAEAYLLVYEAEAKGALNEVGQKVFGIFTTTWDAVMKHVLGTMTNPVV